MRMACWHQRHENTGLNLLLYHGSASYAVEGCDQLSTVQYVLGSKLVHSRLTVKKTSR